MAVTVEEIEILVKANIQDALAGMTKLREQLKDILSAQMPNVQAQIKPAKQILDQYGNAIESVSEQTKKHGDAAKQAAKATQEAAKKEKAALDEIAKEHEKINRIVEEQYNAEKKAREEESKQAAQQYNIPHQRYEQQEFRSSSTSAESVPEPTAWQKFTARYYAALDNVKEALHKVGLYGNEAMGKADKATKAATRSAKKYGDQLQHSAKKGTNGFSKLVNVLKRVLLFSIAYTALGNIVDGVKTGINNLAWASNSANVAMSSLATSSLYLKNSFASALMPAIQAITPVITQVINKIAELFNWIGMLNARIFGGATTVTVAKKASVDYAGTLGKTAYEAQKAADAESKAADAAKKAADANKGSLASFDELSVIQTQTASTSSSSSSTPDTASNAGEGMPAYEDMFETKEIPSSIASIGDTIKTELAKWAGYAQPTIDAFKLLVTSLEPLKTFAAKGVEDFYNDFLVPIGKWTLGEGLPGLLQVLTRFNLNVNWDAINEGLDSIWKALEPLQEHIGEGLLWFLDNALEPFGEWCMNTIVPKVLDIIATSIDIIDSAIEAAKPAFLWLWNNFLKPLGEWTGGVVADALQTIADALHALNDVLKGDFPKAAEDAKKALGDLWDLVGSITGAGGSSIQVQALGDNVSESTKRAIKAFDALSTSADKDLKQLEWSGDNVTKSAANKINKNIQGMADQTIAGFKRQKEESIENIQDLASIAGGISEEESEKIISNVNTTYDSRIKQEQSGQKQIKEILETASSENRGLTQDESEQINQIKSTMYDDGVKALSKNQLEQQAIYENMRVNHTALSAQEAADVVKNSKTATDKVIEDANTQYNDRIAAIIRERDETHTISSDEADKLIAAASKERDETVKSAQDKHQKVVDEAKEESGECVNQVDWQSGEVKTKWQVMTDDMVNTAKTKWQEIKDFFEKSIPEWWNNNVAPWFTKEKWAAEFEHVKQAATDKWNEIKKWWSETAIVKWWNDSVTPWFTKKKWEDMMQGVKDAFGSIFKAAANTAIGMLNGIIKAINWVIKGLNKIHFEMPDWVPKVGGKSFGINIQTVAEIPALAQGGVLKKSTLVNVGEYAGAATNPEIVAPQSIMKETVMDANGPFNAEILNELEALKEAVTTAISSKNLSLSIDGTTLDRATRPAREAESQRIGGALFEI